MAISPPPPKKKGGLGLQMWARCSHMAVHALTANQTCQWEVMTDSHVGRTVQYLVTFLDTAYSVMLVEIFL